MQDAAFVKSQLVAFYKALSKVEAPLKQKHVRALIVGTHKQRSARIFWHAVSRVQLEKNPVLTWKFCHLLHKLFRDGHRKVLDDSLSHCSRLNQLGNFWQHLRTSGYGQANTSYCKMLVSRLKFHKKYPSIVGSLALAPNQIEALLGSDINETYELAIDMLDQMDELLNLKSTVMNIMDSLRWSSLIPQGQCLLSPLILVILDSSKFYDFLVKALFKLHSTLPPDTLTGHRERFYDVFRKTKKFYEEAANLQYFKYLVSIPTLPTMAPNFLQASDLDSYQSPHAYLHAEASSEGGSGDGDASPPDGQSLCDEQTIIDLSMPESSSAEGENTQQQSLFDPKDELIGCLRRDLDSERETRERLIQEARSRIEQYEQRLIQMKQEIDLHQQTADERLEELQSLKTSAQSVQEKAQSADELEKKAQEKEQKFLKMKGIYDNLREEHIKALTEIRDLRSKADTHDKEFQAKVEEIRQISQNLEEAKQERSLVQEQVQTSANSLSSVQSKIENLEAENTKLLEELEKAGKEHSEMVEKLRTENESKQESDRRDAIAGLCAAAATILDQSQEDLQNATSISYPPHLAAISLRNVIEYLDSTLLPSLKSEPMEVPKLCESAIVFVNRLSSMVVNCASSAYTSSIQHFEPVNEECRRVISNTAAFYANLKNFDGEAHSNLLNVKPTLEKLEELVKALPSLSAGDIDVEAVGSQLDDEMKRMDAAIQNAVALIEQLQKKSRENNSGIRLEVNEKILESCTSLMSAVRILVSRSRDVQEEIVSSGKGTASPDEFYKRNHLWSEGLLSAARAVGVAATELVNSADGVVGGTAKYEHLIVAAQEIGASVAQLFVSSRVKADKDSQKMKELGAASKSVNGYTASVVAAVKSGQQSLADEKLLDFTHFSLHEAKKEEMESQVRCLELEASLQGERNRLAALRKQHYHMASLVQNNQSNDKNGTNTMQS
ncbi:ANTH domain-containing protein [Ditylenchus destructor]|uniref:ANTH domain-containing protein n=1 Tax=Ditylenchus destructor TaxID=166010 RepID=A0AAD4N711_9BILA|nr:ANTH domain-containing protein [Ditylenchus destructor]